MNVTRTHNPHSDFPSFLIETEIGNLSLIISNHETMVISGERLTGGDPITVNGVEYNLHQVVERTRKTTSYITNNFDWEVFPSDIDANRCDKFNKKITDSGKKKVAKVLNEAIQYILSNHSMAFLEAKKASLQNKLERSEKEISELQEEINKRMDEQNKLKRDLELLQVRLNYNKMSMES